MIDQWTPRHRGFGLMTDAAITAMPENVPFTAESRQEIERVHGNLRHALDVARFERQTPRLQLVKQ
jgi:hypothetical protein